MIIPLLSNQNTSTNSIQANNGAYSGKYVEMERKMGEEEYIAKHFIGEQ